ncbi:MAG TPA: nicotinate (nicotinamide) nucleotide adenylyltransferase, partial [Candidatus Polarisedimenticolia bacterium]|nr:nicotinate (nicotinamide) nucleotide adenylyltransferase [Candidatus Polarisedimenticolia bacterium]
MRIGILGGTFDPIHRGHLRVAQAAAAAGVDLVALMPVRRPPHKDRDDIAGAYHRFAMAALAAAGERKVTVSTFEVTREAPSYTIDTVRHFVGAGHQVCLIMGSDSLSEIESWRDCRTLIEMAGVIVYPRRPLVPGVLEAKLPDWLRERWAPEG